MTGPTRFAEMPPVAVVYRGDSAVAEMTSQLRLSQRVLDLERGPAVIVLPLSVAAPAPDVVHALVDVLAELGFADVTVAGRADLRSRDVGRRDAVALATAAGFSGSSPAGQPYRVLDLAEEPVGTPGDESPRWRNAALRVVVARAVTDPVDHFAGCLSALTVLDDSTPDATAQQYPPMPATPRGDRRDGVQPRRRRCARAPAADHRHCRDQRRRAAGRRRAGPAVGPGSVGVPVVAAALDSPGLPAGCRIDGDVTPFRGWRPASPVIADALRRLDDAAPAAERLLEQLLAEPGADAQLDRVLRWLKTDLGALFDPSGAAGPAVIGSLGQLLAGWAEWFAGWRTVLAKDRVEQVRVPLGFDLEAYQEPDFRGITDLLAALDPLLDAAPIRDVGLKWCLHEKAVFFEVERVLEAPYPDFVARVDIAAGISLMADYLGGVVQPVLQDERGRVVLQGERNVYLPQPNYLALWGGKPIDVGKIELIEYSDDSCRLSWRTVVSPNGSATFDDGSLTFADAGSGRTRVTIRGRQLFALPSFWEAVDLDRFPDVKAPLVTDAYRRFFTATFDNLEACYEGREFRIGRTPSGNAGPLPTAVLTSLLDMAQAWLAEKPLRERLSELSKIVGLSTRGTTRTAAGRLDEHGFRHFSGTPATDVDETGTVRPPAGLQALARRTVRELGVAAALDWARPYR